MHLPGAVCDSQLIKMDIKWKRPFLLSITLMDDNVITVPVDSSTQKKHLCAQLSEKVQLQEYVGFSLYLFDKILSLGEEDYVLPAINQHVQQFKAQGTHSLHTPWKLSLRKEYFAPGDAYTYDTVALNLIYQQVIKEIKAGKYKYDKEDLAMIAARQYYITYGEILIPERLKALLPTYIPGSALSARGQEYWLEMVLNAHSTCYFIRERVTPHTMKSVIVHHTETKLPLSFSRFFKAYKVGGTSLPNNNVIIAVNRAGVYLMVDTEQVHLELSFPEITAVSCSRSYQSFTLATVWNDEYTFTSSNAEDIRDFIATFLQKLKQQSRFAVALRDSKSEVHSFLSFRKGDLIVLRKSGMITHRGDVLMFTNTDRVIKTAYFCYGECTRTQEFGVFPTEYVYMIPSITEPSPNVLDMYVQKFGEQPFYEAVLQNNFVRHTLEHYSIDHFRSPTYTKFNKLLTTLRIRPFQPDPLWLYSKEPIKEPLLKQLVDKKESHVACMSFLAMLKYMGDYPTRKKGNELTDQIFEPALKHALLRDEVYCQITKQLTENKNKVSDKRGWELMWLATGCFAPSPGLLQEILQFLRTSRHLYAFVSECLARLYKTLNRGQRKCPPIAHELEAVRGNATMIYYKVYFCDETNEFFGVSSKTRTQELCYHIAKRFGLKCTESFHLFVKLSSSDQVISMPEDDFFFDSLHHLIAWSKHGSHVTYKVYFIDVFMNKLWSTAVPGKNANVNGTFCYNKTARLLLPPHSNMKNE